MNPAHLDLFRAVPRHGGMTRAAAALGIGQPHVSRAIAQLETDLGFALFVRGHGAAADHASAAWRASEGAVTGVGQDLEAVPLPSVGAHGVRCQAALGTSPDYFVGVALR